MRPYTLATLLRNRDHLVRALQDCLDRKSKVLSEDEQSDLEGLLKLRIESINVRIGEVRAAEGC